MSKKGKRLRFFGSSHLSDDDHINYLKEKLIEFKPDLILIEGGYEKANFKTEKEALAKGLEMGFVNFYAKENKIPLKGNDPHYSNQVSFMETFADKNIIFLYFVLIFSNHKFSMSNSKEFLDYVKEIIQNVKSMTNWENFDYTFENFERIFFEKFKEKFDMNKDYVDLIDPRSDISEVNRLSKNLDIYRDNYTLRQIMEGFKENKSIFVIKGTHHLKMMEKVLGELFE